MDRDQRQHLEDMAQNYRKRQRALERQQALFGVETSPHITIEIDDLKKKIADIELQLSENTETPGTQSTQSSEIPLLKHLNPLLHLLFGIGNILNTLLDKVTGNTEREIVSSSVASLSSLEQTLYKIAYEVVIDLGLVGARIESLGTDNRTLFAQAYFIDPDLLEISSNLSYQERIDECERQVKFIEQSISKVVGKPVSLKGPNSRFDIKDTHAKENLGVQAFETTPEPRIVTETELFSIFTPVLSEKARPALRDLQKKLGIREVAAVPLLSETSDNQSQVPQFSGVLFVASRYSISETAKNELMNYGRRAAQAILSDRTLQQLKTYRESNVFVPSIIEETEAEKLRRQINNLIIQHWENYHELEIQKAKYKTNIPLYITDTMKREMDEILRLRQEIVHL